MQTPGLVENLWRGFHEAPNRAAPAVKNQYIDGPEVVRNLFMRRSDLIGECRVTRNCLSDAAGNSYFVCDFSMIAGLRATRATLYEAAKRCASAAPKLSPTPTTTATPCCFSEAIGLPLSVRGMLTMHDAVHFAVGYPRRHEPSLLTSDMITRFGCICKEAYIAPKRM